MGSPARRLTNPITRCWAQPNYGYARTDDRQGTDQRLDTKRLTLMSGRILSTVHRPDNHKKRRARPVHEGAARNSLLLW